MLVHKRFLYSTANRFVVHIRNIEIFFYFLATCTLRTSNNWKGQRVEPKDHMKFNIQLRKLVLFSTIVFCIIFIIKSFLLNLQWKEHFWYSTLESPFHDCKESKKCFGYFWQIFSVKILLKSRQKNICLTVEFCLSFLNIFFPYQYPSVPKSSKDNTKRFLVHIFVKHENTFLWKIEQEFLQKFRTKTICSCKETPTHILINFEIFWCCLSGMVVYYTKIQSNINPNFSNRRQECYQKYLYSFCAFLT